MKFLLENSQEDLTILEYIQSEDEKKKGIKKVSYKMKKVLKGRINMKFKMK
jgi:DNA-directed RNA polymerase subunit L